MVIMTLQDNFIIHITLIHSIKFDCFNYRRRRSLNLLRFITLLANLLLILNSNIQENYDIPRICNTNYNNFRIHNIHNISLNNGFFCMNIPFLRYSRMIQHRF